MSTDSLSVDARGDDYTREVVTFRADASYGPLTCRLRHEESDHAIAYKIKAR